MCFMAIFMTSLEKCAFRSLSDFLLSFFLLLFIFSCTSDLYLFVSSVQELGSVILIHNIYLFSFGFFFHIGD